MSIPRYLIFKMLIIIFPLSILALNSTDPNIVKIYLNDLGLKTGTWKNYYDNEYGCCSPYKEIGTGYALKNNLAYYVDGTQMEAVTLKLVLNVNNMDDAGFAHSELLKTAKSLVKKALGITLPVSLADAITKGASISLNETGYSIKLKRVDWPTGKGYELKFTVQ